MIRPLIIVVTIAFLYAVYLTPIQGQGNPRIELPAIYLGLGGKVYRADMVHVVSGRVELCSSAGGLEIAMPSSEILKWPGRINADNIDLSNSLDSYVAIRVTQSGNATDVHFNHLRFGKDAVFHYYIAVGGKPAPWLAGGMQMATPAPSSGDPCSGEQKLTLTIPWSAIAVPFNDNVMISVTACLHLVTRGEGSAPTPVDNKHVLVPLAHATEAIGTASVRFAVIPAFDGFDANDALKVDVPVRTIAGEKLNDKWDYQDQRYAFATQYYQYSPAASTPPPTQTINIVTAATSHPNTVVSLAAPSAAAPIPPHFPALSGELHAPLNQNLEVALALNQNNGSANATEKAVAAAVVPAMHLPSAPSPLPSPACSLCPTLQTTNSTVFDLPKGSTRLLLASTSLGSDDLPFVLGSLPDLQAGAFAQYENADGSFRLGGVQTYIKNVPPVSNAYSDTAFVLFQQRGNAQVSGLAVFVNRPPQPSATVGPALGTPFP